MGPEPREELIASLQAAVDAVPTLPPGSGPQGGEGEPADGEVNSWARPGDGDDAEYQTAKKRAYAILAMRDHSRIELRDKLVRKGHPHDVVENLLDRLESAGLLDDARFAQQFARSQREQKGLSIAALRKRLRDKGVGEDEAEAALVDLDDDYPHALTLAERKAASTREHGYDTRLRRILGVLGRRGFDGGVAMRAARAALDGDVR